MATSALYTSAEDVEQAFYEALEKADVDMLMSLWAEDEDVVCLHPGGPRLVGHDAVRTAWQEILTRGGLALQINRTHIQRSMMVAVHNVLETVLTSNGTPMHFSATNVYFKGPTGWRIVLRHASAVSQGEQPSVFGKTLALH